MEQRPENVITIMVVDDDQTIVDLVVNALAAVGYKTQGFISAKAGIEHFRSAPTDIVITDIIMPEMDGITLMRDLKALSPTTEFIVITGMADRDNAILALRAGAFDFFDKPVSLAELTETLRRTIRYQGALRERDLLDQQLSHLALQDAGKWSVQNLVGTSAAMRKVGDEVRALQVADKTSVLIAGSSGTGKELVARAVHYGSRRAKRPFVPVNCSAIPEHLAESTLFGHVRGAFTGALADKKGCFDMAHEGTLFMDEIGDMHPAIQVKLLRVLEDGVIVPVGSNREHLVDVRVVAATNCDLQSRVQKGAFREDLYYRLARYTIVIPPLCERKDDIPPLTKHFVHLLAGELGMAAPEVRPEFIAALEAYSFPGNVRELRNIIERALIVARGRALTPRDLPFEDHAPTVADGKVSASRGIDELPLNLAKAQELLVRRAVEMAGGNMAKASRLLGINRTKLYRLIGDGGKRGKSGK